MASFKGDSRYTRHVDEAPDNSFLSDEHSQDENDNVCLARVHSVWIEQYYDDIETLYNAYLEIGRATFGGAFHQLGNMKVFADFVFKYMQPGAT